MGTITDRFHEENSTKKFKLIRDPEKYLIEIERTGEIVVSIMYDCDIYIQKIIENIVIWAPLNEKCTLIKNLDGII